MTKDDLQKWLIEGHWAETQRGYGHATAEDLAEALWQVFDIVPKEGV